MTGGGRSARDASKAVGRRALCTGIRYALVTFAEVSLPMEVTSALPPSHHVVLPLSGKDRL